MIVGTLTEARAHLSELPDRVANGEEVIISKAGKPIAMSASSPRTDAALVAL